MKKTTDYMTGYSIYNMSRDSAINMYKNSVRLFNNVMTTAASIMVTKTVEQMVKLGFTYEEMEAIELEVLTA